MYIARLRGQQQARCVAASGDGFVVTSSIGRPLNSDLSALRLALCQRFPRPFRRSGLRTLTFGFSVTNSSGTNAIRMPHPA